MMRPGLWTGFFLLEERSMDLPSMQEDLKRLRKAGFVCGEMDERNAYELFVSCPAKEAKENAFILAEEHFFTQLHAPKPSEDILLQELCEDRILSASVTMQIPVVVTHPFITPSAGEEPKEKSLTFLRRFTDKATRCGLKIALENQIYPVDLNFYLTNIPVLGINIDFAHALATGMNVAEMIRYHGERVYGLHVADSDGRPEDWHIMPGKGKLSWQEVLCALKEARYLGDFHLEIVHERNIEKEKNDQTASEAFSCCSELLCQA